MLSIKPIGSTSQEVSYYANLGQEDYYVKGGEPPGMWCGSGAMALGLAEKVAGKDLGALLAGFSADGRRLVQNAGKRERRSGFDLTWSVPKSVSAALSQADAVLSKEIEAAAATAVKSVLEAVEQFCGRSRCGNRGVNVKNAGLVAALFRHDTSRGLPGKTPDPNLHFHLVVANVSVRPDGSTGALDARALFQPQMKMALGALFRAELSKNLEALGLSSHRPVDDRNRKKSWFELDAIPKSLISEFSKRRRQIEQWLRERGQTGAIAAERAANATRRQKEQFTRSELRANWKSIGMEHGVTSGSLESARIKALRNKNPRVSSTAVVRQALKLITDDHATFSEIELLRYAAQEAQTTGLGIREVQAAVDNAIRDAELLIPLKARDGERLFTTAEMLRLEKELLCTANDNRQSRSHCISSSVVQQHLDSAPTLRSEQRDAIKHLLMSPGKVACVNGMAGTGKTFMLAIADRAWRDVGYETIGTALAAKAAQTLQEGSGIASTHIHRLLYELDSGKRKLTGNTVVVLDEAGMVGTRMMHRLVTVATAAGAKIAMVGDHQQLQAITAGAPFRVLAEQLGVVELTEISRQRDSWARKAVKQFADGEAENALEELLSRGDLLISKDRNSAAKRLIEDWHIEFSKGVDARIFAGTRLETSTINRLCQHERRSRGELGNDHLEVGNDRIYEGDRFVVTRNDRSGILKNGTTGYVTEVNTADDYLRAKLDDGRQVLISPSEFSDLELGYCTTTHKGQGQTVESAFVLAGGMMTDREITYVQSSRARGRTRFYTDVESGGETIETLAKQMNRSRAKDLAHEYSIEAA